MGKLTIKTDDVSLDLRDEYPLIDLSEEHDTSILFGCRDGACGACMIRVLDGEDRLSPMSEDEKDFLETMAAEPNERLACQCKLLGDVTIEVSE
jgi:ferredoxin